MKWRNGKLKKGKKQWKMGLAGFGAGVLVMLAGNMLIDFAGKDNDLVLEKSTLQEQDGLQQEVIEEAEVEENEIGIKTASSVEIPQNFAEKLILYQYIEYGLRKYSEDNNKNERYFCDIEEDILPCDTEFAMKNEWDTPYRTDLSKEIIPELANNIYNFKLEGVNDTIYMSIDTFNMKIYIYDEVDYKNASEEKKNEDEIECVNAVVKKNQDMVVDFLKNYPEEMKWVDISLFDFTKDGKKEIVLSREYLAGLEGSTGVISYNYVYDQEGNELFEFLSAWIASMEIYTESECDSFCICSKMHWGSHNDMTLHSKIAKNEEWEEELRIVEWDMRREIEVESAIEENYYILDILTEEKQELWEGFYEKLIEIRDEENRDINADQFNKFLQNYENLEKSELDIYGSIYYSDNKIITEIEGEQFVITEPME